MEYGDANLGAFRSGFCRLALLALFLCLGAGGWLLLPEEDRGYLTQQPWGSRGPAVWGGGLWPGRWVSQVLGQVGWRRRLLGALAGELRG